MQSLEGKQSENMKAREASHEMSESDTLGIDRLSPFLSQI